MRYEDFSVQLDALPDGTCRARVIASPAGEAAGTFELPVTRAELDALAAHVAGEVRRHRGAAGRPAVSGPVAPPAIRDVGARLFRALFSERVRGRYDESVGRVGQKGGRGLRLKLHLALDDPGAVALHALPWEFLLRPDDASFLALSRDTALVRYVNLPLAVDRLPRSLPLQVLAVPSSQGGDTPLDVERELDALTRGLRGVDGLEIEALRPPTLDGLRKTLVASDVQVLHFMGHGAVDAQGEGVLCFARADGTPCVVSGRELAQQLRDIRSLRLVVLNACDSARASAAAPFTGAATALLQAGVPAVVAMQFPITDEAALAFSETFYGRLAAGDAVDTAVAEARLAITRKLPGSLEWGTPVLFMRLPDGRLFNRPEPAARRIRRAPAAAVASLAVATGVAAWRGTVGGAAPASNHAADPTPLPRGTPAPSSTPSSILPPAPTRTGAVTGTPWPAARPTPSPKPTPRTLQLADLQSADLPEIEATVSVAFNQLFGQETLRVTLSAPGVTGPPPAPIMGPDTLEFRGAGRVWFVDVIVIAWQTRRVTLRVRTA